MIARLIARYAALRPVRSLVFLGAYAAGVAVMLTLLSIGEVMVAQARDEQWVGGGDVTVLPAGVDLETLRLGGNVFYGLEESRFLARQVIGGPRLASGVAALAPWIDDRAIYIRTRDARSPVPARAAGQIPSAARALEAAPDLLAGHWSDREADRSWLDPTPHELYSEIDHFHPVPAGVRGDTTWAEWHYFNLLWPGTRRWLYLSFIVNGDLTTGSGRGMVLARYRTPDGRDRAFLDSVPGTWVRVSQTAPDVAFGVQTVRLLDDPVRYSIHARLPSSDDGPPLAIDLQVRPLPHRYFPPTQLAASDSFVSGYVVPALRATATGRVCRGGECMDAAEALAYHDHNWGTWGGVSWDWGVAHPGDLDILYGGVRGEAAEAARRAGLRFLAYAVDSLGVAGALSLDRIDVSPGQSMRVEGGRVRIPERLGWVAERGADSLSAEIEIRDVALTHLGLGGERDLYFAQMQGRLALRGRLGHRRLSLEGPGFFETYLRPHASDRGASAER